MTACRAAAPATGGVCVLGVGGWGVCVWGGEWVGGCMCGWVGGKGGGWGVRGWVGGWVGGGETYGAEPCQLACMQASRNPGAWCPEAQCC